MEHENHPFAKENHLNQTFTIVFHVNFQGCIMVRDPPLQCHVRPQEIADLLFGTKKGIMVLCIYSFSKAVFHDFATWNGLMFDEKSTG